MYHTLHSELNIDNKFIHLLLKYHLFIPIYFTGEEENWI